MTPKVFLEFKNFFVETSFFFFFFKSNKHHIYMGREEAPLKSRQF